MNKGEGEEKSVTIQLNTIGEDSIGKYSYLYLLISFRVAALQICDQ